LALSEGTTSRVPTSVVSSGGSGVGGASSSASIKVYQDKIFQLEQDSEHQLLENQLLTMRLTALETTTATTASTVTTPSVDSQPQNTSAQNGNSSDTGSDQLRRHYEERIQQLAIQLRFADSKAVAYYDECRNTALRLEMLRNSQAKQGEEYKTVNGTIARLKEDLESTKRNYEEQLSTMTEHIMVMNDKLQQKDAEVDVAKAKGKGKKKDVRARKPQFQDDGPQFFSTA